MNYKAALEKSLKSVLPSAVVKETALPLVDTIKLYLLSEDYYQGPIPADEAQAVSDDPPYWCFCWASGQALAKHIVDNPYLVQGKVVVDFGAGSGVVAVAAALAGADKVFGCDIDDHAKNAIAANAELNNVTIEIIDRLDQLTEPVDLLAAADVLYDRENYPLLDVFAAAANDILVADSRVKELPSDDYIEFARYSLSTLPDLDEHEEFRHVRLFRLER